MKKKYIAFILTLVISLTSLISCQSDKKDSDQMTSSKAATESSVENETINFDELKQYLEKTNGGNLIVSSNLNDKNELKFIFGPYSEYKSLNPQSQVTEKDYNDYFNSGDKDIKLLFDDTIRLFKEYSGLTKISITINYENKTLKTNISKEAIESLIGKNLSEVDKVSDLTYDKDLRNKFKQEFVK
jgi:hypothetical protein